VPALQATRDYAPALLARFCAPAKRFVIITTGRTGSELLVSLLNSHPGIRCGGELLRDGRAFPQQYLAARAAMAGLRGMSAFGWKLLPGHFRNLGGTIRGIGDPTQYPARLNAMGYRPVLLLRANPVQQALSFISGADRQFHYSNESDDGFEPIEVDPVRLMAATWIVESDTEVLSRLVGPLPHLRLSYEDDLLDSVAHQTTVDRVCEYLGIDSAPVTAGLRKANPRQTREIIANFDEVRKLFASTRYASYFDAA